MKTRYMPYVRWLSDVENSDVAEVGGKNASLGELIKHLSLKGVNIPMGFTTTSTAYRNYLLINELEDNIKTHLEQYQSGLITVEEAGRSIRKLIGDGIFPIPMAEAIRTAYADLCKMYDIENVDVAVRSSATAEDLPTTSFSGLQETFLNVRGEEELLKACRKCYASLFTARAIVYRDEKGFNHFKVALCIGVQKMIRADNACSGVMFTLDTETGFPNLVVINGAWGLGENVVRGVVSPDKFSVFKPLLKKKGAVPIIEKILGSKEQKMIYSSGEDSQMISVHTSVEERASFVLKDDEILTLARWASMIEDHYGMPMDIEWVKDDKTGELYIVQTRPETGYSSETKASVFKNYRLIEKHAPLLLTGLSIGNSIVTGTIKKISSVDDLESITSKDILVTQMTEPDWVPSMQKAAGIITDFGGRTCHAAVVSRELGIPAIVGTLYGSSVLKTGQQITFSCAEGDEGRIYNGRLNFEIQEIDLKTLPKIKTNIMINLAVPESAFKWWRLPVKGVGLARMEFIISHHIKVHPMALIHFDKVLKEKDREKIRKLTRNYEIKTDYFVDELSRGIAKVAASQYPKQVIIRTSDFKTNEYAGLIGGRPFELNESNPMIGWRGASRYFSENYREGFELECRAIKKVRDKMGLDNLTVMIPFCRTIEEARKVLEIMELNGLKRGEENLQIYMMCEVPSNVILAEEFARYFDGFSIGSNDLTQLILGVDRDSANLSYLFNEDDGAVKNAIKQVIQKAHKRGIHVGFCGQAPSDDPTYAAFLVEAGVDSISLNPDSIANVIWQIHEIEQTMRTTKV